MHPTRTPERVRAPRRPAVLAAACLSAGLPPAPADAQEAPASRLEEIVVTASVIETPRRRIGAAVSSIGADEIRLRGYHSIADVLRTQPGIGVTNGGGLGKTTTLRIRGEEAFRTLLIIDGVKAVDPSAPQVAPSFDGLVTTPDLARIEVLRGPQGFIYGADAGGVVNVLTRRGEGGLDIGLGGSHGGNGTRRYEASAAGGGAAGDFFVSGTRLTTDGFNARSADTSLADDDGARNTTLHTKLGWNATERLRVQLVARDVAATAEYDGCFVPGASTTTHDCVSRTAQTTYRVSAEQAGERFGHSFGYSRAKLARSELADASRAFSSHGELARLGYTGSYAASDAATFVYGIDLQTETLVGDTPSERTQAGWYGEYQGRIGEHLYLSAGARYDDNEDFGAHTSTRLSAAYVDALSGGGSLKYRASIGTGFRAPSLYEIAYDAGPSAFPPASNVTLGEESSRGYDVGFDYYAAGGAHLEATWFEHEIENEIFFDLTSFSGYLQSGGTSRSSGIELAFHVPLGTRWSLDANWTRNDTDDLTGAQRPRRPRDFGNVGLRYASRTENLRVVANYRASRNAVDVGGVALDDYEVLDVSVAYRFEGPLELHARVENLTDAAYRELIGYNTPGRTGYAGFRLWF